ncbi:1-phosphofructokinase family hexose kinase [Actinomadura sp. ATCC 31491]|uniref:1-phosphofructokinase family hexose kinase n=1 Tax=Actinomadura luzonensis TaxID=2805427 RepID=A0ABT0G3M0_9ACTN|nr:1-phosphofructokinase family hexose kinase [Actinomadura luzonensis]MCK2219203.1 1-phosphofructokinase family hexose kinase [Actinomadura luzonensis]
MILTLTLNPSLDRTIEIAALDRGAVIRAAAARLDPGGKGVNVSRALLANGVASRAVVPFGGDEGRQLVRLLAAEGLDMVTVPVTGRTRSNVTLAEPDGTVTKINEPGTALSAVELDTIADAVLAAAHGQALAGGGGPGDGRSDGPRDDRSDGLSPGRSDGLRRSLDDGPGASRGDGSGGGRGADWVVASGSLPPEVPADVYARLCRRFAGAGIQVAVDTSGPALSCAVGAAPALVKPNLEELGQVTGRPLLRLGDVVEAAGVLRAAGARRVLASLGADGAVLVEDGGVWYGRAPVAGPRSSVGAGDAMLAGFLAAGGCGPEALARALAWGAAAVRLPGSRLPGPADIDPAPVAVGPPDLACPLTVPHLPPAPAAPASLP